MSKLQDWKQEAPANCYTCCTATLKEGNVPAELFGRSWQGRLSPLIWRVPICLWALVSICWSIVGFWGPREKFLLYMTNWGLIMIFIESLFGIFVTIKKMRGHLADPTQGLPWYVKTYWVLYNITVPLAFLISLFYWAILRAPGKKIIFLNPILDIMIHGVNSGVMFLELVLSVHPSRFVNIMQPLYFAGVYLLFSMIYYGAGGLDPKGNAFIYPVIDWSKPLQTLVVVILTALFLGLMHIVTVMVASFRDFIIRKYVKDKNGQYNDGFDA